MPRLIRNTTVLLKSESSYGIDAMPTAADGVLVLTGVDFQPDFRFVDRTVARPGLGASPNLMGAQISKLDLAFELAGPQSGQAPAWDGIIKALGFGTTMLANPDRVEYAPRSVDHVSATAYVYSDGVLYKVVGCLGAGSIEIEAGNTPKVRASLQGLYVGEYAAGSVAVPAMANWKAPVVVSKANVTDLNLGCTYAAGALAGGTIYASRGMTIDLGNQVEYIEMCSNDFLAITQRAMKATVTFDLTAAQEVSFISRMRAGTLGSQGFIVGNQVGNTILLHMPAGQFSAPRITDVSGVRLMAFESTLTPTGAGDDELRIVCLLGTPTSAGGGNDPPPPAVQDPAAFGRVMEPILRLSQVMRAFNFTSESGRTLMNLTDGNAQLGQTPLRSPSVFNVNRPGYVPAGGEAETKAMTVPELQNTDEASVAGFIAFMDTTLNAGFGLKGLDGAASKPDMQPDFTAELALATDAAALVDAVMAKLLPEPLDAATRQTIIDTVGTIPSTTGAARLRRVRAAAVLVMGTPEWVVAA